MLKDLRKVRVEIRQHSSRMIAKSDLRSLLAQQFPHGGLFDPSHGIRGFIRGAALSINLGHARKNPVRFRMKRVCHFFRRASKEA